MERRDFIKMLGLAGSSTAAYAACSSYMSEALANSTLVTDLLTADPHCENGSLKDIEHVVILMQGNRSFDHYFGTLRGVRGFGDPRPARLKNGNPVWQQSKDNTEIKPYRLPKGAGDKDAGHLFLQEPNHDFVSGLAAWNSGRSDQWIDQKGPVSMAHYGESDIPLYFQLARAFTICDAYHCSVKGATDPNRSYLWTGTSACRYREKDFREINDDPLETEPFSFEALFQEVTGAAEVIVGRPGWKSYPEQLEELQIDWKFYQDGRSLTKDDPFTGNYGNNTLEYFKQYRDGLNPDGTLKPDDKRSALNRKSQTVNSILRTDPNKPSKFEQDVIDGRLPSVSWIVAPQAFCESPKYPPHFGEFYLSEILRALLANKDVWHKAALLVTYDENGGFFDHVLPPSPPMNDGAGKASWGMNLSTSGKSDDVNSEANAYRPLGLGMRVPMLVISPWSVGGRVCSETFDHTSVIKFLDAWLKAKSVLATDAPAFPLISSWRNEITGDLTSAFDFSRVDVKPMEELLDKLQPTKIHTPSERQAAKNATAYKPDIVTILKGPDAAKPVLTKQDQSSCELLPIEYDFQAFCSLTSESTARLRITFRNRGKLGVAFTVLSYDRDDGGWFDGVEGIKKDSLPVEVFDTWNLTGTKMPGYKTGDYSYAVHGPNGYLAEFRGASTSQTDKLIPEFANVHSAGDARTIIFTFEKWPSANGKLKAISAYTGEEKIIDNGTKTVSFPTKDGWYDISFFDAVNSSKYLRRYAGHAENGKISRTDPAIGMKYDEVSRIYVPVKS